MDIEEEFKHGTKSSLKKDFSDPNELKTALNSPKDIKELQEALTYQVENPVTFSGQLDKIQREIKQCDSEIMENVNIIIASFQQVSLVPHSYESIRHLKKRKEELRDLQVLLLSEINENRIRKNRGQNVDENYL